MIFSRRSRGGRHAAKAEQRERVGDSAAMPDASSAARPAPDEEKAGPYDFAEAPEAFRVDLGSLHLPAIDGVEIRAHAGEDGVIQQLELVHGASGLMLGVFAAPRSESLWEEVRPEIRKALIADGAGAEEVPGQWGMELRARVRTQQGFDDRRFIGIDGPRWMVHAVFRGPAASDPAQAGPLQDCLTGLVVNRDEQARPPREALPLRLPQDVPGAPEPEAADEVPGRKPSTRPGKN